MSSTVSSPGTQIPSNAWVAGDGFGKFVRARYIGVIPEGGLLIAMLLLSVFGFAWEVVESGMIGSALGGGLQSSLHMSASALSWSLSAISIAAILSYPISGPLVDIFGRKPLIMVGLFGFVITDLIKATAPNLAVMVVALVIDGCLVMVTTGPTMALVRDFTPRTRRGLGFGVITALGWGGGTLITVWAASPILNHLAHDRLFGQEGTWRWLYFFAAIAVFIAAVVQLFFLKDMHPSLRAVRRGLTASDEDALVEMERAERGSVLEGIKAYLGNWRMISIFLNQGLWGIGWAGAVSFLPVILLSAFKGISPSTATFLAGWVWIGYLVSSALTSLLQDLWHVRKPFSVLGMIGAGVMLLVFAAEMYSTASTAAVGVTLTLLGIFAGAQYPAFAVVLAGEAERINARAVASAFACYSIVSNAVGFVPRFVFPIVGEGSSTGWRVAVLIMAVAVLLAAPTLAAAHGSWRPRRILPTDEAAEYF
jgi:MFS family permease